MIELNEFLAYFGMLSLILLSLGGYYYVKRKEEKELGRVWHRIHYDKVTTKRGIDL